MADITFFKYLEAAFRYRLFNSQGQKATLKTRFNYLGFNLPYERIFYYARRVLPPFYRNEAQFPNTEEGNLRLAKTILEKLDRHLDLQLEQYFKGQTTPSEIEPVTGEATTESAAVPGPVPSGAAGGEIPSTMIGGQPAPIFRPSIPSMPKVPRALGEAGKTLASDTSIGIKKGLTRVSSGFSGILGGVARGGGNLLGGLAGGGGRFFTKVGLGGADTLVGFSNQISRGSIIKGPPKKVWLILLGAFLLVGALAAFAPAPGGSGTSNVGIGPTTPGAGGDISSCLFTRSDQSPKSATFRSQQLLDIFQEASQKSGIPAVVLAGIARIESPSIVNFTDDNLSSYGCPTSETGAKGLMQIQPPGTIGSSSRGIELGSQYLGVPVDQLNYCDLRQSIFLGAGVINAKRGGAWDSNKTYDKNYIDSVAESYYGCLRYGGPPGIRCSDPRRIYSYGDDLYKSISECKPTGPVLADASCPIPDGKIGCASYGRVESWGGFNGVCAPDTTGNGGHCNQNYVNAVGICGDVIRDGNLIRTAKSIDISNNTKAGDPVVLPNINGRSVRWQYVGAVSAGGGIETVTTPGSAVPKDRPRFGWIRIFHSEGAEEGIWTLHLVHVEESLPPIREGDILASGLNGARVLNPWIKNDNWPHVHVTIGLNVGDSKNDLKNYDPGWKFADRELGMCTK